MHSRRVWLRVILVIAQMMIIRLFLRCLHDDMMGRLVAPALLHRHRRQTPLYLLYLSG